MTPRTFSLAGCRTRAEAVARMRAWLEEICADREREWETNLLVSGRLPDVDDIDDELEFVRERNTAANEEALTEFKQFLDREFGPESGNA